MSAAELMCSCGEEIDWIHGKAFRGYVHIETGQHGCADGKRYAAPAARENEAISHGRKS